MKYEQLQRGIHLLIALAQCLATVICLDLGNILCVDMILIATLRPAHNPV